MPDITVVVSAKESLRGLTEDDHKAYVKFKRWLANLEPGELFTLSYKQSRNYKFLKKYMAMMKLAFDAWEPEKARKRLTYKGVPIEKSFDQFRHDTMIQAGYYTARYDARGRVTLEAKSISYDKMTEDQFAEVYEACLKVLLERVLTNYTRAEADRVIDELQRFGS